MVNERAAPKVLAYADDVTCLTDSRYSLKYIFKEYERLSKASNLVLNAEKTEILYKRQKQFSYRYLNVQYQVMSCTDLKINGLIFNTNGEEMKRQNFDMLVDKIKKALAGWSARRLSLLG